MPRFDCRFVKNPDDTSKGVLVIEVQKEIAEYGEVRGSIQGTLSKRIEKLDGNLLDIADTVEDDYTPQNPSSMRFTSLGRMLRGSGFQPCARRPCGTSIQKKALEQRSHG